jgi:hypothetical protein
MVQGAMTIALLGVASSPAQAQSNFTFDPAKSVLIDNATGLQWQCGWGWAYSQEFITGSATYEWGRDVYPGRYSACPYGDGGGWRMPKTAELSNALQRGLYQELKNVAALCATQPLPPGQSEYPWAPAPTHQIWVIDPQANKQWAYALVAGTGARVRQTHGSALLVIVCR